MTGSGTLADPYIIWDVNDLQDMNLDLAAYYELGQDIDASATSTWHGGAGFIPVGDNVTRFNGNLDGKGFTISELFINRPATSRVGLFGCIDEGTVIDLALENCTMTGERYVGGLVGLFYDGTIADCDMSGTIVGTHPSACAAGGLVGLFSDGTIRECYSSANVRVNYDAVGGGLIGWQRYGSTTFCFATGDVESDIGGFHAVSVLGGLIGFLQYGGVSPNLGYVGNCYAKGNVTVNGANGYAGGLIGFIQDNPATVENCYSMGIPQGKNDDDVIPYPYEGGLIAYAGTVASVTNCFWDTETSGLATSDGGTGKTTAEMKTQSTFTDPGWDFTTIWGMCTGGIIDYPCLLSVTPSCSTIVLATVTTNPATGVVPYQAILNGLLDDDGGEACECGFEWGETIAYGNTTATQSKVAGQAFSDIIYGLDYGVPYHFRAFATNAAGTVYGADRTTIIAPSVTTDAASDIAYHTATLNLTLDNDGGQTCECWFEFTGVPNTTSSGWCATGDSFSYGVTDLDYDTVFSFRAVARNGAGTSYGDWETFTTLGWENKGTIMQPEYLLLLEVA